MGVQEKVLTKQSWERAWKKCTQCPLHKNARNHVLYRGQIPAEVLLIGEAPGKTEDKIGEPFIGRSGQLLTKAMEALRIKSYCIANVVCCIPLVQKLDGPTEALPIRPPSREEAEACSPHLEQLFKLCSPKVIALLGNEAKEHFNLKLVPEWATVVMLRHPAYILRKGGENSVEYKRFVESFANALDEAAVSHVNPFTALGV